MFTLDLLTSEVNNLIDAWRKTNVPLSDFEITKGTDWAVIRTVYGMELYSSLEYTRIISTMRKVLRQSKTPYFLGMQNGEHEMFCFNSLSVPLYVKPIVDSSDYFDRQEQFERYRVALLLQATG